MSYSIETFQFHPPYQITLRRKVLNVVPGDFTRDGRLDLLVMAESTTSQSVLDMFLYLGVAGGGFGALLDSVTLLLLADFFLGSDETVITIPSSTTVQPIPMDVSGLMKIDLLGVESHLSGRSGLTLWNNTRIKRDDTGDLFSLYVPHQIYLIFIGLLSWLQRGRAF